MNLQDLEPKGTRQRHIQCGLNGYIHFTVTNIAATNVLLSLPLHVSSLAKFLQVSLQGHRGAPVFLPVCVTTTQTQVLTNP